MTMLLMTAAGFFFAYAVYISTVSARASPRPGDFLDAGLEIPSWGYVFGGAGVILAGLNLHDHLLLVSSYGLQYSHVAVGLVLVALTGALVQKRVWLASRITGLRTIGDLMGEYFRSPSIRIYLLLLLFLFSVPFAGYWLSTMGFLVAETTEGALPSSFVIWVAAFFLFLHSVIGGWRAVVYVVAGQSLLVLALLVFIGGFAGLTFDGLAFFAQGVATAEGTLPDRIPGVIQFTGGIGKAAPSGGLWTTLAIASFALSMIGLVLSPGFGFLGLTTSTKKGFAFNQVWMTAGLGAGALVLIAPLVGAEVAASAASGLDGGRVGFAGFVARLGAVDELVAICFLVMLLASLQIAVAFFTASGASIVTIELVARYVVPDLTAAGQKTAARIALAAMYFLVALTATFFPLSAAIVSSLALSLAAQMLPAFIGLCWLVWVSRSAVITGLIAGMIVVVFTDPLGLLAFEMLFVDLPWGRWPLTIHSAGWGLAVNIIACLLVSVLTLSDEEGIHRQRLHDQFGRHHGVSFGGPASRTAVWALTLIWAFLAVGPGAILGNTFFSQPVFAGGAVELGVPSLLAWQILFWLVGVLVVWWLAYHIPMSTIEQAPRRTLVLDAPANTLHQQPTPAWIARLLERVAAR